MFVIARVRIFDEVVVRNHAIYRLSQPSEVLNVPRVEPREPVQPVFEMACNYFDFSSIPRKKLPYALKGMNFLRDKIVVEYLRFKRSAGGFGNMNKKEHGLGRIRSGVVGMGQFCKELRVAFLECLVHPFSKVIFPISLFALPVVTLGVFLSLFSPTGELAIPLLIDNRE